MNNNLSVVPESCQYYLLLFLIILLEPRSREMEKRGICVTWNSGMNLQRWDTPLGSVLLNQREPVKGVVLTAQVIQGCALVLHSQKWDTHSLWFSVKRWCWRSLVLLSLCFYCKKKKKAHFYCKRCSSPGKQKWWNSICSVRMGNGKNVTAQIWFQVHQSRKQ